VYNKDTVGYSSEQRRFNLFVDIQAQQDAPTQDKDTVICWTKEDNQFLTVQFGVCGVISFATVDLDAQ
jgi:hypothetical protein